MMNKQSTASEVRDLAKRGTDAMQQFIDGRHTLHIPPQHDDADMVIAECLRAMDAFADMLEAQEKAVPVATCGYSSTVEHRASNANVVGSNPIARSNSDAERLAEALRMCMDIMLEHGVPIHPDADARVAYTAAEQAITAHSAQAQPPAASVPDIDVMVTRFLGWRLPQDFAPDAGISFKPMPDIYMPHCWPTGTNLFHAGQAKKMILHMLGAQENPNG